MKFKIIRPPLDRLQTTIERESSLFDIDSGWTTEYDCEAPVSVPYQIEVGEQAAYEVARDLNGYMHTGFFVIEAESGERWVMQFNAKWTLEANAWHKDGFPIPHIDAARESAG